jgi:hypothetical protein
VRADRITETTPDSGVYYAEVAVIIVRNMDDAPPQGKTLTQIQSEQCQSVETALEAIPKPGYDDDVGLVLHGMVIEEIVPNVKDGQLLADVFGVRFGCGLLERDPLNPDTPQAEL